MESPAAENPVEFDPAEPITEFDPKIHPLPVVSEHPCRFAINGVLDKLAALREFISAQEFDPDLKTYLGTELDEFTCNAAEIHLHLVDHLGLHGGFDLHLTLRGKNLGLIASGDFSKRRDPEEKFEFYAEDKLDDLRTLIAAQEFDPDLKTYLSTEFDELTTNAATVRLVLVDFPGEHGGMDLHLAVRGLHLGAHDHAITQRGKLTPADS